MIPYYDNQLTIDFRETPEEIDSLKVIYGAFNPEIEDVLKGAGDEIYKEMTDQIFKRLEKIHYEESWKSYMEWHEKYMKESDNGTKE